MLAGAQSVSRGKPIDIYWNAPTSEDNIKAQISLLEHVIHSGRYDGIVLAPDHALALMSAVQDAQAAGIPVVIVSSRLSLPATRGLSYILNNDRQGGQMAANDLGRILHGHGTAAIIGIDPAITGNMKRERSLEATLRENYPGITIVARRFGAYNIPHETQVVATLLKRHPCLSAIIALNPAAERGAWNTLLSEGKIARIKVVGFDQDMVVDGEHHIRINAIIEQNTYKMGQLAVQHILDDIHHRNAPPVTYLAPILVTRAAIPANARARPRQGSRTP